MEHRRGVTRLTAHVDYAPCVFDLKTRGEKIKEVVVCACEIVPPPACRKVGGSVKQIRSLCMV